MKKPLEPELRLRSAQLWKLGVEWAEYEEQHGTLILGYSLKFFLLHYAFDDIL